MVVILACSAVLSVYAVIYWVNNPDQNHSGTQYDCYAGSGVLENGALTYNFAIKANNSEFVYPDPTIFTQTQMQSVFTKNVTQEFTVWFMWAFILQLTFTVGSFSVLL